MTGRPAAGGGRWVTVPPARLARWLAGFGERHGAVTVESSPETVVVTAEDNARAFVEVPFPPLDVLPPEPDPGPLSRTSGLVEHVLRDRTVGVLLARKGGHAAGVFVGDELVASKVGSRHVQGRSAAGGWSQQRFARRREGQAAVAAQAAADDAAPVLLGRPLEALVLGGERAAVDTVLADRRLAGLRPLVTGRLLEVPDPRLAVLRAAPYRDVWIRVVDG